MSTEKSEKRELGRKESNTCVISLHKAPYFKQDPRLAPTFGKNSFTKGGFHKERADGLDMTTPPTIQEANSHFLLFRLYPEPQLSPPLVPNLNHEFWSGISTT